MSVLSTSEEETGSKEMNLNMKIKTIFDLTALELEELIGTGGVLGLEEITLDGIEKRPDFDKLFAKRNDIAYIAAVLLKEKQKHSVELKSQRIELRKRELKVKEERVKERTFMNEQIYKRLRSLEGMILALHTNIIDLDRKIDDIREALDIEISESLPHINRHGGGKKPLQSDTD